MKKHLDHDLLLPLTTRHFRKSGRGRAWFAEFGDYCRLGGSLSCTVHWPTKMSIPTGNQPLGMGKWFR
jgi:hypothetical protein